MLPRQSHYVILEALFLRPYHVQDVSANVKRHVGSIGTIYTTTVSQTNVSTLMNNTCYGIGKTDASEKTSS